MSTERNRVATVQRCLVEEILPRLIGDGMPAPRSERQRACLRVLTNYVATLIEGNERYLARKGSKVKR